MFTTTKSNFSANYLRDEFAGLRFPKNAGKFWLAVPLILSISFALNLLLDIEYAGQDLLVRGPRIISWLKIFLPTQEVNPDDEKLHPELPLFTNGRASIQATAVRQNSVYDCRFLAALASFAATERGRDCIFHMIEMNDDGSYTVKFPQAQMEPITVAPLSGLELKVYSRAVGADGFSAGIWVPVIEKAYGTFLDRHQSLGERSFHFLRHGGKILQRTNHAAERSIQKPSHRKMLFWTEHRTITLIASRKKRNHSSPNIFDTYRSRAVLRQLLS